VTPIQLGEHPWRLADLLAASQHGTQLALSPAAHQRVIAARAVVDRLAAGDTPIYGLNTGLGGNLGYRLQPQEIAAFQAQMIRGRCIGVGTPFPEPLSRTALLCRLIGLAQGGSGLSPDVLDKMIALFNAGLTPVIPGRGSIGAGDLGLCAQIGLALIGEGSIHTNGRTMPAAAALAEAGLHPAVLGPKDALAILNASAITTAHAALVLSELSALLGLSVITAALTDEGYAANADIFDARLAEARPAAGQARVAAMFRAVLRGSHLHDQGAARSIQDALSFRVLAQIIAPALMSLEAAIDAVETEINAAADNPLVLAATGQILSTANFHTPGIALAFDTLAIAVTHLATAESYRIFKLMNPTLSGLARYLSPVGGPSAGFNPLQKTVAALHAEIRLRATPASLDSLPVSDSVEDHAPHTPLTIRKLEEQLQPFRLLLAIEALVAAQAVDLRGRPRLSPATHLLFTAIRAEVPMLQEDRPTGPDVDRVATLLQSDSLRHALIAAVPQDWAIPVLT
jgi:histidine ammonia-lyase